MNWNTTDKGRAAAMKGGRYPLGQGEEKDS
jgi:hypothetical protein